MNSNTEMTRYSLVNERGNAIGGTTRERWVTCKKCRQYRRSHEPIRKTVPRRAADAEVRTTRRRHV
jgi:hypothetical protein